jgi:hypothetical protein
MWGLTTCQSAKTLDVLPPNISFGMLHASTPPPPANTPYVPSLFFMASTFIIRIEGFVGVCERS